MHRKTLLALIALLSLAAGLMVNFSLRYAPFTLVIQTKTLEKGKREVVCIDQGGQEVRIPFEIGSDSGEPAVYSIELPRRLLKSVTIPPLAAPGRYEIEGLTLSNHVISYQWNGSTDCSSRLASEPVGVHAPCTADSPAVSTSEDGSITITKISVTGVPEKSLTRVGKAAVVAVLFFLAGLYLLRPVAEGAVRSAACLERAGWLLFIALYLYQLSMLWNYAVDLPFWEEWEFFEADALQRGLTLEWLFRHFGTNQQVVVFTKLMAWLDYKLFGLDFAKLKLMNYLVFGLFQLALVKFVRQVSGHRFWFVPLFMLFLLSPLAYEAHAASFQSGEIFVLLFSTLMLCYSAPEKPGRLESGLFSAAAVGAIFSMHTGVAVAGILLVGRSVFILFRMLSKEGDKRDAVISLIISCLITFSGIIFWFTGFRNPTEASVRLMPTEGRFWVQFFDLLSYGFGLDSSNPLPGLVILVFLLVPLILLLLDGISRWKGGTWQIMQAIIVLLAIAAMITFGRGATFTTLKLSRYTVYITPLVLFGALAWGLALRERKALAGVMAAFWVFCFVAFSDNWNYSIYRDLRQMDLATLECVEAYNNGSGDGNCPDTHGVPIGRFFDNARKLDINFTRQFSRYGQPK